MANDLLLSHRCCTSLLLAVSTILAPGSEQTALPLPVPSAQHPAFWLSGPSVPLYSGGLVLAQGRLERLSSGPNLPRASCFVWGPSVPGSGFNLPMASGISAACTFAIAGSQPPVCPGSRCTSALVSKPLVQSFFCQLQVVFHSSISHRSISHSSISALLPSLFFHSPPFLWPLGVFWRCVDLSAEAVSFRDSLVEF